MQWALDVICKEKDPVSHPRYNMIVTFMKRFLGLPVRSFTAAAIKLCNLPTMADLVLPRI